MSTQAVKNLVFCAKVLHRFQLAGSIDSRKEDYTNSDNGCHTNPRDLAWLIAQFARLARFEAGHHPKQSQKVKIISCTYEILTLSHE